MTGTPEDDITELLLAWSHGRGEVLDELVEKVQNRLHRLAASFLQRERSDHTLETSALVNEAYLRLVKEDRVEWQDRAHFFAIAGQIMRRILVDHARSRGNQKRGGQVQKVPLEGIQLAGDHPIDIVELNDALGALAEKDAELARVVELKYFGGLRREEIAVVTNLSPATVTRRWRNARAWLYRYLVLGETDDDL